MTIVKTISPNKEESIQIKQLLDHIINDCKLTDQYQFLEQAPIFSHELPRSLREELYKFKRHESYAALHISNNPVLSQAQPTPTKLIELEQGYQLNDAKILLGLYGSLLGEGIGFTSQRGGSVYNNIIPFKELQNVANSSSGSNQDFGFHVEDAFHPSRAEFLGLVCMRNEEQAPTTVSCIDGIQLTNQEKDILFQDRFFISHNPIHEAVDVIEEDAQAIFFGSRDNPYIRINAASLKLDKNNQEEINAVNKVLDHLVANKNAVVLGATDCIFVDNFRCAHARDKYEPFFGDNARWLARVVFASDLKKSRGLRATNSSRSIVA